LAPSAHGVHLVEMPENHPKKSTIRRRRRWRLHGVCNYPEAPSTRSRYSSIRAPPAVE